MGKMSLGLDDRSARLIHGRDVWMQIKGLLSGYNDVRAAIAFVGSDADQYLPLRGPATIVVNAGDAALASGATDPQVLLRWTRRGVRVHSLDSLHAKALLAVGNPSFVVVGSADVTSSSGRSFDEAVLVADESETVEELHGALQEWKRRAGEPLTEAWLQEASSRFRPPVPHRASSADRQVERVAAAAPVRPPAPVNVSAPRPEPVASETFTSEPAASEPAVPALLEPSIVELSPMPESVAGSEDEAGAAQPPEAVAVSESAIDPGNAVAPETAGEPEPAVVPDSAVVPESSAVPATAVEPESAAVTESAALPESATAPETAVEPEDDGVVEPVEWPRPKYIYLATLTQDGRASESAQEQLEQLRSEYRAPTSTSRAAVLDVDVFWSDEAPRSSGKPRPTYRAGWHIVPISVPASGRPAVLSAVTSPGRVLHSYTEYVGGPARTYYYLLQHRAGPSTTFRKLREALTAVGEKPSYDHAYMMQHKVAAILDLWPEIDYSD
ncbi:hypothetical protein ABIB25_003300 [Nakamurella sp. UYEF19]|uniref:hypothetical protein n=1 Tax=Nakamurella sp. UYEF19 TaxID=1756392 RepID=UPI0033987E63